LRSLQYFEAVARHGSIKRAADESHVSSSAISHHLRALKEYLGEELFVRAGRGIRLTETGQRLYQQVSALFETLDRTLAGTVGQARPLISIAVCSSFGPGWLAKRLPDFLKRNPTIDIGLRLFAEDPEQSGNVADAIVTATDIGAGYEAFTLFEEMLVAVVGRDTPLNSDGRPLQLITTDTEPHAFAEDWRDFQAITGQDLIATASKGVMRSTHYLLALALAQRGVGAALVPDFLAEDGLENGDLRLLSPEKVPAERTYRFCYKTSREREPEIAALARWMKAQTMQLAAVEGGLSRRRLASPQTLRSGSNS
jgi:LysR family glycine cleavage system transcriptional activator